MSESKYDDQRSQGAEQIIAKAKELAGESGINLSECLWNKGNQRKDHEHRHEVRHGCFEHSLHWHPRDTTGDKETKTNRRCD